MLLYGVICGFRNQQITNNEESRKRRQSKLIINQSLSECTTFLSAGFSFVNFVLEVILWTISTLMFCAIV